MKNGAKQKINTFFHSISTKIMLVILILVLPLNITAIILSNVTMENMIDQAKISVQNVMEGYLTDIQNRMSNAQYFIYNIRMEDPDALKMLQAEDNYSYEMSKISLFYRVRRTRDLVNGADGYFLNVLKTEDILYWYKVNDPGYDYIQGKFENGYKKGWSIEELDHIPILSFFIEYQNTVYGGWIYMDQFIRDLENDIQYQTIEITFSEEKKTEDNNMVINLETENNKFYLSAVWDQAEVIGGISRIYKILQIFAGIEIFLIPVLYSFVYCLLVQPLQIVNQAQKNLQDGDLAYRIQKRGNSSEYDYSFRAFNMMAEKIQKLKIESYEKELERQKMELRNLQLQIRPHFLLNTFNLIYTLSQRNEREEIQSIILYLSDYFRYLFRSGKDVELFEKELRLIEAYIHMATVRYPDSIVFSYEIDPEIRFVRIPPLLLHNFVENIVKHVVQQGVVTHITLIGQYDDQQVTFMIMDDGPGMKPETVEELDQTMRQKEPGSSHIGFVNSLRRVKYFYGEKADIIISSEIGLGTCVTIEFPYNLEEEYESFNCK